MLLDSPEIYKIENRFISLFERTFKKGINPSTYTPSTFKTSVKRAFSSVTFRTQLDRLIDDIYLYSIEATDKLIEQSLNASLQRTPRTHFLSAADTNTQDTPLILTEEAVNQSTDLALEVSESIIRMLQEEGIYQENPRKLAGRIIDLWGGEKYRAVRFTRTITADIATNTSLFRFKDQGIEKVQFYATIDKRTSSQCRMLHGTVMLADSPEATRYIPPLHPSCRSSILPITIFSEYDKSMEFQNRDFSKPMDEAMDKEAIEKVFKDIDKFKEKYSIPKFVFDEDIEKRLMKLGVGVEGK